ncbi:CKLF-like MARVEL transmembrane domain-containing protein 2 [Ursus americanus]|uniref:CKLF-like MARVEL transmembrane domain-containing protein 2 isoform X1 n=2 Tax=Ursus maritimus TaxID=29073 RepID=A0A384D151_URSMA|nr:CKLF-like MARVEL transmembrane domain-containing protein 2 isoform X1 [Ursus maritimus]XP_026350706.2 CKLF-like MARVEL transmembrane domain-containing protein 2 [Ursus arctos]XP_045670952.1 CKLF-like MARVEL transmembrane domain-containing protein 2 [Ursus americanus]
MADKGKKGKPAAPAPAAAPPPPPPPPPDTKPEDKKDQEPKKKEKSVQPKNEVGTRKGCRRYKWELKDSNREFWVMGHAEVKILSFGCLIAAMIMFTGTTVHPLLTLIITMELSVFCFFFIIYTFAINRYMPFILWPISDLLNDLFAFIFLVGAVVLAVRSRQTMPMNYFIAVILIGVAGLFALIDICLQRKHFKGKRVKRNVLIPPPGKDQKGEKPKEPEKPPEKAPPEKPKDKGKAGKK